jgi:hypothetical protein
MHMRVSLEGRRVRFTSRLDQAVIREPQQILKRTAPRSADFIRMCGWCKKIAVPEDRWEDVELAIPLLGLQAAHALPALTHGICPRCFACVSADFAE